MQESFAKQQETVSKNRKKDGRANMVMTDKEIQKVWEQIGTEYPWMESVADSAVLTNHLLQDEPIVYCNDEFTQLTGYPKEEILGRNCRFLQGKYSDPKTVEQIRDALRTGSKLEVQLLNYRKDGTPFINGFCLLPLHEKGLATGAVTHFLAIQKNVTVIVNPFRAPMASWTTPEVLMWLDANNAGSYIRGFQARDVDGTALERLGREQLVEFGIVLDSEQKRLFELIQAAKRGQEKGNGNLKGGLTSVDNTSFDESVSRNFAPEETSEDFSEVGTPKKKMPSKSPSGGATFRKATITCSFKNAARAPFSIVVSSAAVTLDELRKVLRKKTGRKFHVQSFEAPGGLSNAISVVLEPSNEGLDPSHFAVLEGVPNPVVITDNLGLVVYANDIAYEMVLRGDPLECFVADVCTDLTLSSGKLDFVSDMLMRARTLSATTKDGDRANIVVNPVTIAKCKLFVWYFDTTLSL